MLPMVQVFLSMSLQRKAFPMSDLSSLSPALAGLTAGLWNVDSSHSTVGFTARHLMITKVRGRFGTVSGLVTVAEDPLLSTVNATVDVASVTTGDEGRDGHLKSPDFFDVEQFPSWSLVSTGLATKGDKFSLTADLSIKGVTKPVEFDLEFDGVSPDPWGGTRASFSASAEINRKDWGLEWNVALETGGLLVSEKVKIELEIQLVKAS
jgi:polyisoprenoid-binding protein YceI